MYIYFLAIIESYQLRRFEGTGTIYPIMDDFTAEPNLITAPHPHYIQDCTRNQDTMITGCKL